MAVDSRSSLSWDYLNSALRLNFSHALKSASSTKDLQSYLNLVASLSDAFMSHGIKVLLSGSMADGSFVHPVLRSNMQEIDIMCIPKVLRISEQEQHSMLYDVPSAPGFIWLHVPDPGRVKHIVRKSKRSNLTLASLKKVRNARSGKVEHFLVGKCKVFANTEPFSHKNRTNLFDEFRTQSPFGGLVSAVFGSQGLFFGSAGKEKGSAAYTATLEARVRPPQVGGNPKNFFLTEILPKFIEGVIEGRADSSSDSSEDEDEAEHEATVMAPYHYQGCDEWETDWRDELPRPSTSFEKCENSMPIPNLADYKVESTSFEVDDESSHGYVNFGGSFDLVPAIECEGWPLKARGFIGRDRKWPSPRLIRQITQGGFHLVSKCSPNGNKEMEWRISFSVAEITLFENMSVFQRKCYQVFKAIFYSELTGPKVLSSYHMKTIFLWACERLPEEYWDENHFAQIIVGLLDDLLHCLVTRSCPHFFIPENDQFAHVPEEFLFEHARTVCKIRSQPDRYPSKETQRRLRRGVRPKEDCEGIPTDDCDEHPETLVSDEQLTTTSQEEIDLD